MKKTFDGTEKLRKHLESLAGRKIMIGIPASQGQRDEGPINNAALGYIHEFGSPSQNIPARPFLIPGVRDAIPKARVKLGEAIKDILRGKQEDAQKALHAAGIIASSRVKMKLVEGPFAPLSGSTIRARERRGVSRTKPLIDTGDMQRHITYVVR